MPRRMTYYRDGASVQSAKLPMMMSERCCGRRRGAGSGHASGSEGGAAPASQSHTDQARHAVPMGAEGKTRISVDPTLRTDPLVKEKARDRVLDDGEIVWFWRAAERAGWPFGPLFRLLLLTAQRESEVAGMRWSEIDLEKRLWTLPRERTKSDRGHVVHLSELAMDVIAILSRLGDLVFPSRVGTVISSFSKLQGTARCGDAGTIAPGHRRLPPHGLLLGSFTICADRQRRSWRKS